MPPCCCFPRVPQSAKRSYPLRLISMSYLTTLLTAKEVENAADAKTGWKLLRCAHGGGIVPAIEREW
jgi:hypothetical protein